MTIPPRVPGRSCQTCGGRNRAEFPYCQHCGHALPDVGPFASPSLPTPLPPPPPPPAPDEVSGMGVIYLCYDQQACEPVAIKTYLEGLPGSSGGESEFAQQFESEALLWIGLGRHPHVVQARYVLRLGGKPHIFLEFVPGPAGGESTVRRLLRAGRVDTATALLLAIQPGPAVEAARQACLAGLPSHRHRPPGGSGTVPVPVDGLDLRT